MKITDKKLCFGLIAGTRGFFNPELARQGRIDLVSLVEKLGYDYIILPENETPTGSVETIHDAAKVSRLFAEHREKIDGIIVCLPNCFARLEQQPWRGLILFWKPQGII